MSGMVVGKENTDLRSGAGGLRRSVTGIYYESIDGLKGLARGKLASDPRVIESVAKEMESQFVYEMVKAMREASGSPSEGDFGRDVYTGMFDMELARFISGRGVGLQDLVVRDLNKRLGKTEETGVGAIKSKSQNRGASSPSTGIPSPHVKNNPELVKGSKEAGYKDKEGTKAPGRKPNPYLSLNYFPDLIAISEGETIQKTNGIKVGVYTDKTEFQTSNPYLSLNRFPDLIALRRGKETQEDKEVDRRIDQKSGNPYISDFNMDTPKKVGLDVPRNGSLGSDYGDPSIPVSDMDPFLLPVNGTISSHFGMRLHPIYGDMRFHHGLDIAAPAGTGIRSIKKGRVVFSGMQSGYGNVIVIDHGDGFTTKYAHNEVNLVKEGDEVDTDTIIGLIGSTGMSTGPHLHFEVRYKGRSVDPLKLTKESERISDKMNRTISI